MTGRKRKTFGAFCFQKTVGISWKEGKYTRWCADFGVPQQVYIGGQRLAGRGVFLHHKDRDNRQGRDYRHDRVDGVQVQSICY